MLNRHQRTRNENNATMNAPGMLNGRRLAGAGDLGSGGGEGFSSMFFSGRLMGYGVGVGTRLSPPCDRRREQMGSRQGTDARAGSAERERQSPNCALDPSIVRKVV